MKRAVPVGLARFDSATAMTQGLACCLYGRPFPVLSGPLATPVVATLVNGLPKPLRDAFYTLGGYYEAAPKEKVAEIDADAVAAWLVSLYPLRRYPAVAVGSANGAFIHLCAAMGVPWLPQTVLTVVRRSGVCRAPSCLVSGAWAQRLPFAGGNLHPIGAVLGAPPGGGAVVACVQHRTVGAHPEPLSGGGRPLR